MTGRILSRALKPSHPGELIFRLLVENKVSKRAASGALGISRTQLYNLLDGKAGVSPDMAVRLGKFFGNGPDIWLRLQNRFDLWHAQKKAEAKKQEIVPITAIATMR